MEAAGGRAGVVAAGEGVAGWGRANGEATVGDGCTGSEAVFTLAMPPLTPAAVATARSQQPSSALLVAISQKHASVTNSGINNSGSGSRVLALAGWQQHRGVLCSPHRAHPASSSSSCSFLEWCCSAYKVLDQMPGVGVFVRRG